MKMKSPSIPCLLAFIIAAIPQAPAAEIPANLQAENLAAWCIVPFDAKKRSPAERAAMLKELGVLRCAYDWRNEHVAEFEEEILQYQKHGIEFFAFWGGHEEAYKLFEKYDLHPQIWRTLGSPTEGTQDEKIEAAANSMEVLAKRSSELGCKLGLYNHGGWGGEPDNLIAVCKRLREKGHQHVGIVYNWHHGHGHISDWTASFAQMKPYLLCLNLNGMNTGAEPKILPLAQGEHELEMLKVVLESGYDGPIGILDHQGHLDAKESLQDNLDGLEWLKKELANPGSAGPRPKPLATSQHKAPIPFNREPLDPALNPSYREYVNRDRVYDFYAKQALHYGKMEVSAAPDVLPAYPGPDGGGYGHWGNQNDQDTWKDGRVRDMDHGSMASGVFRGAGKTIPRAVSVELGGGLNAVFNQDTLRFEAAWKGGLVKWSDVRRGFMHGIPIGSDDRVQLSQAPPPGGTARYLGLHRSASGIVFSYMENGKVNYRLALAKDGKVEESMVAKPEPFQPQWPERIRTAGRLGEGQPYAIDTLTLPYENSGNVLFFVSGMDFVTRDRIAICNLHGDVWICDVSDENLAELSWKRFAAGLHQPLGLKVVDGLIHVMCRDQIVALRDLNGDDEADFYECVSNAQQTSAGGHDFITGLQRDEAGRWYFASGNQGICRVSADGENLEVLGSGLRNPNGLGISPDGEVVLSSVQEGSWTPASAICDLSGGGHFGAGGPKAGERGYVPPMVYLPRGVDNSCGGQAYIDSDRWGPTKGNWVHFSIGAATHFLVLRDVVNGQSQAAAIPLPGEFLSGCHRGRFSPYDGQLYVAGAQGWGNYGVKDGSLQRVRFTGGAYPYPVEWEACENGILLTFADPQASEIADSGLWFAQQWNYLYAPAYGSPEFSVKSPEQPGHDRLEIRSVHRIGDGTRVFLEIPQLRPVNQLHLHFAGAPRIELFATIHDQGEPFTSFPGYQPVQKVDAAIAVGLPGAVDFSPAALMNACAACHHPTRLVVGPPISEIRLRYANNPDGIVKWAMNPENKNPERPPMPSFQFLGEEILRVIADRILSGE